MKKKVLACVLSGILAVSIFGCGSKSMMATESAVADSAAYDDMAYDSGYDTTEAASAEEAGSGAVTSENGIEEVQETDRKLIRNVNLSLQTKEFDTVLESEDKRSGRIYSGFFCVGQQFGLFQQSFRKLHTSHSV